MHDLPLTDVFARFGLTVLLGFMKRGKGRWFPQ
jgi:hypothetical protein